MAKPPATVFLVTSLCRLRRAYATAVSVGMGSVDELRESLLELRDRIDGLTAGSERMVISPMNKMNLRSLCSARKSLEEKAFRYFDHTGMDDPMAARQIRAEKCRSSFHRATQPRLGHCCWHHGLDFYRFTQARHTFLVKDFYPMRTINS